MSESNGKTVLLYACSGGANVAEAADRAARQLMNEGAGTMFCMAGVAAGIDGMVETARKADTNIVIDGCPMDCARKVFEQQAIPNTTMLRVTDMGIDKAPKGTRCTDADVQTVTAQVRAHLAASPS